MCDLGDIGNAVGSTNPLGESIKNEIFGKKSRKGGVGTTQRQINKYNAFIRAMVDIQKKVQPDVTALERGNATSLAGIYEDILGPSNNRLQATANTSQREADLADFQNLGADFTQARTAAAEADPLVAQLRAAAMQDVANGSNMSPEELRKAQQLSRMNRTGRGFGQGSENDLFREALDLLSSGEQLRGDRLTRAAGLLGATGGNSVDPFLAITGRPSSTPGLTQSAYGQAVGNSRFNPVESTYSSDLLNNYYAQKMNSQNNTTALIGAGIGAVGNIAGSLGKLCWVAREVYGADNPRWLQFRNWLLCCAPSWFVNLYTLTGPVVAAFLRANPEHKPHVREWMEARIESMSGPHSDEVMTVNPS